MEGLEYQIKNPQNHLWVKMIDGRILANSPTKFPDVPVKDKSDDLPPESSTDPEPNNQVKPMDQTKSESPGEESRDQDFEVFGFGF